MSRFTEIRWHGRGGQGAKTAALVLGEAILGAGKFMQAFPEYGPERMGAPVKSFNRMSDEPIRLHTGVTTPDIVLVLDESLMTTIDVTQGLSESGVLIVNTARSPKDVRRAIGLKGGNVFTVDASAISKEELGRPIPNMPMLGALMKATSMLDWSSMLRNTREKLEKKFKSKPEVVDGNIRAMERAHTEVQSECL